MERRDNYARQAEQARAHFLSYDQDRLIRKLKLKADEDWLYTSLFGTPYRICRHTGSLRRREGEEWIPADSFGETMTILDLVCDSREDRYLGCRWKNMTDFGLQFHRDLMEEADPWAERFAADPEGLRRACLAMGGTPLSVGDVAYAIEIFDGLPVAVQLWLGDEEFPANLRLLWDENALMYIKYETMYYARALLLHRLAALME